jgi:hypothetical protein
MVAAMRKFTCISRYLPLTKDGFEMTRSRTPAKPALSNRNSKSAYGQCREMMF